MVTKGKKSETRIAANVLAVHRDRILENTTFSNFQCEAKKETK